MTRPEEQRSADRILSTVIARHALTNAVVSYVTSSFNTIYRVSADQGEFMLRVSPPQRIHEQDVTEADEAWTDRVRGAGLAAPQLIRAFDGSTVLTEGRGEGGQAVLLTWLDGTDLQWPLTPGQIELLGELSAQLHRAVSPTATRTPGVLDASNPILFAVPDLLSTAPSAHRALFRRRFSEAQACLREVWSTANEMPRVLHFDLTPRNVLQLADGRLAVIDCQDLAWGHPAQDIANTIYGITRGELDETVTALFRAGYQRHAAWPDLDAGRLRQLFIARRIVMINLALTLRRPGLAAYLDRHAAALS